MKFAKILHQQQSALPELESLFLRYKQLKKHIKGIAPSNSTNNSTISQNHDVDGAVELTSAADASTSGQQLAPGDVQQQQLPSSPPPQQQQQQQQQQGVSSSAAVSEEEAQFINTLNQDLVRFNAFFMEREEEAVIQLQALHDWLATAKTPEAQAAVKQRLVDFHGSCVLLMHWSLLNYAAIAKILKKHDKRTGLLIRAPYLANVLQQPFNSTTVMSGLITRAEKLLNGTMSPTDQLQAGPSAASVAQPEETNTTADVDVHGVDVAEAQRKGSVPAARCAACGSAEPRSSSGVPASESENEEGTTTHLDPTYAVPDNAVARRTALALQTWDALTKNVSTPSTFAQQPATSSLRSCPASRRSSPPPSTGVNSSAPTWPVPGAAEQPHDTLGVADNAKEALEALPGLVPHSPVRWDPFGRDSIKSLEAPAWASMLGNMDMSDDTDDEDRGPKQAQHGQSSAPNAQQGRRTDLRKRVVSDAGVTAPEAKRQCA